VALFKAGMAGREHLERFQDEAGQYAATVKGGLGGGATAVAVAVVEAGADGTRAWAVSPPPRALSGRTATFPVLVDVAARTVDCPGQPEDLARLVREHVVPSMRLV
jgi:hypothetical protein